MEKKKKIRGDDPRLNERKPAMGERRIDIDDQVWGWRVGSTNVVITAPNGSKVPVPKMLLGHERWDEKIEVRTGDVADYIRRVLVRTHAA